jgi:hypothetical protein
MRKNNYIAIAFGIGIIGVFAILIVLSAVTANKPDVEGVKFAAVKDNAYGSILLPEAISWFQADGQGIQFEIKEGDLTKFDVGEPIVATVDARNVGSSYSFNQVIKGRHDEIIELTCNGSRPQPPKLHIKNKDGSYDRTFSFQYG